MRLEIPEPCHENWQQMTPQDKGRFCDKCCKVVVDFTNMPIGDVIRFISERKNERVCGRFRSDQVASPAPAVHKSVYERLKKFLAAIVLVFGGALFTGCHTHEEKVGKVKSVNPPAGAQLQATTDTVPDTLKALPPVKKGEVKCIPPPEEIIQGGISFEPEPEPPLMGKPVFIPDSL